MFRLLHRLKQLFEMKREDSESRIFLQDEKILIDVREVARQHGLSEEETVADLTKAGLNQLQVEVEMSQSWNSLSQREKQVVALICLGYRNYQIAETLMIAPETVKTHLQRIFAKFNLRSSRELRLVLKNWNFAEWWKQNQKM